MGQSESSLRQTTLRHHIGCVGVGVHSGARVAVTLRPAGPDEGIRFVRIDRAERPTIPGTLGAVVEAEACIVLGNAAGARIAAVEHLMAAFALCDIDNAVVEVSGPEIPVLDGSASPFTFLIECAGRMEQEAPPLRRSSSPAARRPFLGRGRDQPGPGRGAASPVRSGPLQPGDRAPAAGPGRACRAAQGGYRGGPRRRSGAYARRRRPARADPDRCDPGAQPRRPSVRRRGCPSRSSRHAGRAPAAGRRPEGRSSRAATRTTRSGSSFCGWSRAFRPPAGASSRCVAVAGVGHQRAALTALASSA